MQYFAHNNSNPDYSYVLTRYYDVNHQLIEIIRKYKSGEANTHKRTYEYNSLGNLSKMNIYENEDLHYYLTYEYNYDDKLEKRIWHDSDSEGVRQISLFSYATAL